MKFGADAFGTIPFGTPVSLGTILPFITDWWDIQCKDESLWALPLKPAPAFIVEPKSDGEWEVLDPTILGKGLREC